MIFAAFALAAKGITKLKCWTRTGEKYHERNNENEMGQEARSIQ